MPMGGGGRRGGGGMGGGMGGGARRSASPPRMANAAPRQTGGARAGRGMGGSAARRPKRLANVPKQRVGRNKNKPDRRGLPKPVDVRDPSQDTVDWREIPDNFGGGGGIDFSGIADLFGQQEEGDYTTEEFDKKSVTEPYQRYSGNDEDDWITGLMQRGQKGYELPKRVTLESAMDSPFRYYGSY